MSYRRAVGGQQSTEEVEGRRTGTRDSELPRPAALDTGRRGGLRFNFEVVLSRRVGRTLTGKAQPTAATRARDMKLHAEGAGRGQYANDDDDSTVAFFTEMDSSSNSDAFPEAVS